MQEESCRQKCVRPRFISSGAGTVGGEEFEGKKKKKTKNPQHNTVVEITEM